MATVRDAFEGHVLPGIVGVERVVAIEPPEDELDGK